MRSTMLNPLSYRVVCSLRWRYAFSLQAFKNHCSIFPDFYHIQITIFYKYKKKKNLFSIAFFPLQACEVHYRRGVGNSTINSTSDSVGVTIESTRSVVFAVRQVRLFFCIRI